ncbi:hypothetical protein DS2_12739 [Catenovulum agarivorans DS-2]|uniref:Plasmid partition ParA protein n=1 Tax=Catenovulum agarivorans DS-2 TaxID=1328313 RepID=W7QKC5_9ALTE|nr:DUF1365 domain-containing protein [Catenovulum agarivorans]EWH09402.1 hypothetical protein DS2_12739 [Catenovulum agarivorans DS-2]
MLQSGLFSGYVRHRRFNKANHAFGYNLSMFVFDLDQPLSAVCNKSMFFGDKWYNPVRFNQADYVNQLSAVTNSSGEPLSLKQRIQLKVSELGGDWSGDKVVMVGQCRGLGLYFSPVNFYFCYQNEQLQYMLAEVSNTPWNERHFYLVDMQHTQTTEKVFHVSPFMTLNMNYVWRINVKHNKVLVHIENHAVNHPDVADGTKLFDATLNLKQTQVSSTKLVKEAFLVPLMPLKVVAAIYWQAVKLFFKRVPFVPYQTKGEARGASAQSKY